MKTAEEFLKQMNYSTNTQVSVRENELARKKILNVGAHPISTKLMREFVSK